MASSFEKCLAPPSCARMFSTEGKICHSRHTFAFSLVKSTHILTLPAGFGMATIPAHHFVGLVTLDMTPSLVIRSSSSFTLGRSGMATCLGTDKANGMAPYLSFIL